MEQNRCLFCGGDRSEPDHDARCDGKQGGRDDEPKVIRIRKPRETSVQAFYNAVNTGVIRTRREQAWLGLQALGSGTSNEVFEYLKEQRHLGLRYDSNTRARFTEMRDDGLVREVGTRPCHVTGATAIVWEVVPSSDYAGVATKHRCPTCGQITSRDVPLRKTGT